MSVKPFPNKCNPVGAIGKEAGFGPGWESVPKFYGPKEKRFEGSKNFFGVGLKAKMSEREGNYCFD
jgi:hypothetical protein